MHIKSTGRCMNSFPTQLLLSRSHSSRGKREKSKKSWKETKKESKGRKWEYASKVWYDLIPTRKLRYRVPFPPRSWNKRRKRGNRKRLRWENIIGKWAPDSPFSSSMENETRSKKLRCIQSRTEYVGTCRNIAVYLKSLLGNVTVFLFPT